MKKPTKSEIETEITALRRIKNKVRHYSAFGDDNRAAIGAEIAVLLKRLTVDEAMEMYDGFPDNIVDSARDAAEWLVGEWNEEFGASPSESWKTLEVKAE
jgi:hypothetical protein